jgi:hypothetical protein
MTKKERTIKAFEKLAWRYRNPLGLIFFTSSHCPLCVIHDMMRGCRGCPLASKRGHGECFDFTSCRNARKKNRELTHIDSHDKPCKEFIKRAEFFEKYLPVIKKWPASRFTKKGWKYSGDEISREE